jgi:hypothetical protein
MTIKTLSYAALAERLKCGLETARSLVTGEVATLKARIELLQAELVKLEATAARHRADYERERDRADRLVSELLKVTANTTKEMAASWRAKLRRLAAEGGADIMGAMASLDRLPGPWPMTGRAPPRDSWTFADLCVADKATPADDTGDGSSLRGSEAAAIPTIRQDAVDLSLTRS